MLASLDSVFFMSGLVLSWPMLGAAMLANLLSELLHVRFGDLIDGQLAGRVFARLSIPLFGPSCHHWVPAGTPTRREWNSRVSMFNFTQQARRQWLCQAFADSLRGGLKLTGKRQTCRPRMYWSTDS